MNRQYLKRAAAVLREMGWEQMTGMEPNADYLEYSIKEVFKGPSKRVMKNFYRGFKQIINDMTPGSSIEEMLRFLFEYLQNELAQNVPLDNRMISGYVTGGLAAVKAVIEYVETRGF